MGMCGDDDVKPSTVSQTSIPDWAKPYAENTLASTQKLLYNIGPNNEVQGLKPMAKYSGPGADTNRVAGFTSMEEQAARNAQGMRPDMGGVESLQDEYSGVRDFLQGTGNMARDSRYVTGNAEAMIPEYQKTRGNYDQLGHEALDTTRGYDPAAFEQNSIRDPGMVQSYMDPYMQNVVDIQKREAARDALITNNFNQAKAVQGGAFGGGRDALIRSEAQRNLGTRMGDLQATGSQAAYKSAVDQYNAEREREFGAQKEREASRQYGKNLGLKGVETALTATKGYGDMVSDEAAKRLTAGAQGLQGLEAANTSANLYGQSTADEASKRLAYGQQNYDQQMGITNQLAQFGGIQRAANQQGIDNSYQDYLNAQNYPYKQLAFSSNMLTGQPMGDTSVYEAAPSTTSQLAGLGTAGVAGLGMYNSLNK